MSYIDWLGFVGVFLILLAYLLNITNKLKSTNVLYILLNLIGAGLACIASILLKYIPFVILEGIWTLVSLVMLFKYFSNKKRQ